MEVEDLLTSSWKKKKRKQQQNCIFMEWSSAISASSRCLRAALIELDDSRSCLCIFSHELSAFTAGLLQEEIQGILKGVKDGRVEQRAVRRVTASVRSRKATGRRINGHTAGGDSRMDISTLQHPLFPTWIKYCKCFPARVFMLVWAQRKCL